MTIREALAEMLLLHRESLSELRAIRAVLEGPPSEFQPDLEKVIGQAQSATELVRLGVLRRHR